MAAARCTAASLGAAPIPPSRFKTRFSITFENRSFPPNLPLIARPKCSILASWKIFVRHSWRERAVILCYLCVLDFADTQQEPQRGRSANCATMAEKKCAQTAKCEAAGMLPQVREQGRLVIIFPRKKMGEVSRGTDAVWLSVEVLNTLFDFSLPQAAKHLVISPIL